VELSRHPLHTQEVFVSHANAALTPIQRLRIGKLIVDGGVPIAQAAQVFMVSWPTAKRWADRYRAQLEVSTVSVRPADLQDRSSRPHQSPRRTPQPIVRKIVYLRWRSAWGRCRSPGA